MDSQRLPNQEMNNKERADVYMALAKAAYERFDKLADYSWKLRFSVWTAFAIASGFIINADKWKPSWIECIIGSLLAIGIIIVVVFLWGAFNYRRSTRWVRVASFWNLEVEKLIGVKVPDYLREKEWNKTSGWDPGDPLEPWYKQPIYLSQALITVFLCCSL
jgi:hypothetical protein